MLHVMVRGRVQGVGFRWFVRERARELRLKGWVRNTQDGSVEVFAVGEPDALQQLRSALGAGPTGAHVDRIEDRTDGPAAAAMDPFGILK